MSNLIEWKAVYVEPGTRYVDEPDQTVPVGWYVASVDPADPDRETKAEIQIHYAVDENGGDQTGVLAEQIAALLNADRVDCSQCGAKVDQLCEPGCPASSEVAS